jgi:hypothetical protein
MRAQMPRKAIARTGFSRSMGMEDRCGMAKRVPDFHAKVIPSSPCIVPTEQFPVRKPNLALSVIQPAKSDYGRMPGVRPERFP